MTHQPAITDATASHALPPQGTTGAQTTARVLMVRPASFGWNPQTGASNRFQREDARLALDANQRACAEFDTLVLQLRTAGVDVWVEHDAATPTCPDAVFPNNWVSLHEDGTVVLYPMLARNRRLERRLDAVTALAAARGLRVTRLLDLTHHEANERSLEGTGSIVFDHAHRVAYACLSPRTHRGVLEELCDELGYTPCSFAACDAGGVAIYHTNVMLAIGTQFSVVGAEAIERRDRDRVLESLATGGRQLAVIDAAQIAGFAGNVLELRGSDGGSVLALSQCAYEAFGVGDRERLASCVDRVVAAPIPTIERLGGGSVRCMLAEVFLPQ